MDDDATCHKEALNANDASFLSPPVSAAAVVARPRRPPQMMLVFSLFSPKKVPFEDTTEAVVVLAVRDDGEGRWDGGAVVGGGVGDVVGGVACHPVGEGGGD